MTDIKQVQNLVVLRNGLDRARKILRGAVSASDRSKVNSVVNKINTSDDLDGKPYKINEKSGEITLSRQLHKQVIEAILKQKPTQPDQTPDHLLEPTTKYQGLTEYEQGVQDTVNYSTDILKRVFNRRSGLAAWLFAGYAKLTGLTENDDFTSIEKEKSNNPKFPKRAAEFAKQAAKLYKGEEGVKFENKKQEKLAGLIGTVRNICNVIPRWFVDNFAKCFVWVNVSSPWIAHIFKGNLIGNIFTVLKCVNPFIDEFMSVYPALCGDEVLENKNILDKEKEHEDKVQKLNISSVEVNHNGATVRTPIETVELLDLDKKGYEFKNTYNTLDAGVSRLVKPRNIAGWALEKFLKAKGFDNWKAFEKEYVKNPEVVKNVYEQLQQLASVNNKSAQRAFKMGSKFPGKPIESGVASGSMAFLSIVNSLPKWLIEKAPKYFGLPFSIIYTTFPTLNVLIGEESFLGKVVGWTHRLAPLVNDFFVDIIASMFEEATTVKTAMEENKDLYKGLPKGSSVISEGIGILKKQAGRLGNLLGGKSARRRKPA